MRLVAVLVHLQCRVVRCQTLQTAIELRRVAYHTASCRACGRCRSRVCRLGTVVMLRAALLLRAVRIVRSTLVVFAKDGAHRPWEEPPHRACVSLQRLGVDRPQPQGRLEGQRVSSRVERKSPAQLQNCMHYINPCITHFAAHWTYASWWAGPETHACSEGANHADRVQPLESVASHLPSP